MGLHGRGGRHLAAGHAVDEVVDADDHQVHVAPRGVDEVVAADGGEVAVAGVDDHVQLGVGQLQAGGEGNGAAVGGVEGVQLHVAGDAAGAADAGDDGDLVQVDARLPISARAKQLTVVPMPQPGHQMCGMRSMRRNSLRPDSARLSSSGGAHRAPLSGSLRGSRCGSWTVPPACGTGITLAAAAGGSARPRRTIWPRLSSGHHERLHLGRPARGSASRGTARRVMRRSCPTLQPLLARHLDRARCGHARGDAVGDDHDLGVVERCPPRRRSVLGQRSARSCRPGGATSFSWRRGVIAG